MSEITKKNFNHEVVKSLTLDQFIEQQPHIDADKLKEIYSELDGGSAIKAEPAKPKSK